MAQIYYISYLTHTIPYRAFYFLFLFFPLIGCLGALDGCGSSTIEIIDYYQISKYIETSDDENIFYCKLGFKGDPIISHIRYVEWNEKIIKLIDDDNRHYIIIAKKDKLCCGCGDRVEGPLDAKEYRKVLQELNQTMKLRNSREIK